MSLDRKGDSNVCYFSKLFIRFLENLGYFVPDYHGSVFSVFYHIAFLALDIGVLIISVYSISRVVFTTCFMHFLNLMYTWLVTRKKMLSYSNQWEREHKLANAVVPRVPHSPYHNRQSVLLTIVGAIGVTLLLLVIPITVIDESTIFAVVTWLCMLINFFLKYLDALILLFDATVKTN